MNKKEFLFRIPSKKSAWALLELLDHVALDHNHTINFDKCTSARDSLYLQICNYYGKKPGWPAAKIAETYPRKKCKRKHIKRIYKRLTR